jgi:23S rRNA (cytosine1962-C5)-methyltransferase
MMQRPYSKAVVSAKAERYLRQHHPWVYNTDILLAPESAVNGDLVDVVTEKGRWMGTGFYNSNSKLALRVVSRNTNDRFDRAFWQRRVRYALQYRKTVMPGEDFRCCRLIHGEADGFPGLTVDRYGEILVAQCQCLGLDRIKQEIYDALLAQLRDAGESIQGLYERNDGPLRAKEGLPSEKGFYAGTGSGSCLIRENGLELLVDYENGQKTGYFLDQKRNRQAVARLAAGRSVLDCFAHTGGFGLNCAAAGAKRVVCVDVSQAALDTAGKNAALNHLHPEFLCQDVFVLLDSLSLGNAKPFDLIILDPPAFTKSRGTLRSALRGYREINRKAMRLLPRGGYLATCSCSHFVTDALFCEMLRAAAMDADVTLKQVEARQQSPDHPIDWDVPETSYLKFYIFQVC